jgi:hypothetical protein
MAHWTHVIAMARKTVVLTPLVACLPVVWAYARLLFLLY